jgi:hypothetical protein
VLEAASVAGMESSATWVAAALDTDVLEVEGCCEALACRRLFLDSGKGLIPSCNSWSKKDIRGSIELLVNRSPGWGESQKRLPTCRLRGLMSGSSRVQRPGVSGAGR